ncbi:hypothetical protein L210DRAFT_3640888 [Boletus edulis BED1]|uniref:DH domain-containing protein n=1 Tax=Boletus edulis BED1 TaxID=1328754 RepID=A0AAD4C5Q8_BOLED|nr:hypothetical protein L210DRAFT_3640888 [Boletus edulis BED1]
MSSANPSHLVSFPTSESVVVSSTSPPLPVPHLPFRRISLPTTPSPALAAAHRQSVASLASLDSLAEESPAVHQYRRVKRRSLNPRSHRRTQADDDRQAKRSKIISEFYVTEKSYLDGLDLVYNHFLTPILRSLDTSRPLLTRNEITTLFSNIIDIWNFHHTFFAALSRRINPSTPTSNHNTPISSLLLAHFPYLSLYAPFVTAFPAALAFLISLSQPSMPNPAFVAFLRAQESQPVCAHLRLADYLLTPVQRCPRYLLLLKDLLSATDPDDPEWEKLQEVRGLVEKITVSLNTSLAAHAQTLALISLQRNTRDLPPVLNPLVAPGRQLIKRGTLIRSGGEGEGAGRKPFEFLLLSDYLLWLEREETGISVLVHDGGCQSPRKRRASISALGGIDEEKWWCRGSMSLVDMEVVIVVDRPSGVGEERIEVLSPEGSFALHHGSPPSNMEDSNSLSSWVESIRTARTARLAALALSNPDSTLSASTSGVHLRRALRAFASESDDIEHEQKLEEVGGGSETAYGSLQGGSSSSGISRSRPRRAKLDNFLPPVWVPDAKTDACMKCGRPFGFALDLRLGDVFGWGFGKGNTSGVEAQDDGDASPARKRQKPKPARACEECYEAAFPFISPSQIVAELFSPTTQLSSSSRTPSDRPTTPLADEVPDALHGIQPWLSIPSHQASSKDIGEALMAMDLSPPMGALSRSPSRVALSTSPSRIGLSSSPSRKSRLSVSPTKTSSPLRDTHAQVHAISGSATNSPSKRIMHLPRISSGDSDPKPPSPLRALHAEHPNEGANPDNHQEDRGYTPTRPIRVRPSSTRPRSYHDILEDFSQHERGLSIPSSVSSAPGLGSVCEGEDGAEGEDGVGIEIRRVPHPEFSLDGRSQENVGMARRESDSEQGPMDGGGSIPREDTARRRKRFSMPAVALQTAPVFARARKDSEGSSGEKRRSTHVGERDKGKKERQGEKEGSAVGLLMEVLRGKVKYPGRN